MNFLVAMLSRSQLNCRVLLTSLIVFTFGITSCDSSEEKKNEVSVDGGAVGFPIHQAVAEEFQKAKPNAQVSVASSGTGGGIRRLPINLLPIRQVELGYPI